jgi:hypothetical protein
LNGFDPCDLRDMQQVDIMIAAIACSSGNGSVVTADSDLI